MKIIKIIVPLVICFSSCANKEKNIFTELNDSESASPNVVTGDYESQWFQYPDTINYIDLCNLCVVQYRVNGDTLFTSEKYHFLTIGYSWDEDSTLAYQHIIFFNKSQQADSNGWYKIVIDKHNIPREPETHLSSIALRAYLGDKYDYLHEPHADAHLFNSTMEIGSGRDRNVLSPELSKLYDIIK